MEDSSSNILNTDNSISSKETRINTSPNFDGNIPISPYLQKHIIKSITLNLKEIIKENIRKNHSKFIKYDLFYMGKLPPISIEDYINRIFKNTKMNMSSLIISVIYIDKFCELNGYVLSFKNIHRIILTACYLSIKFNEDITVSTKYYADIAGIPIYELNNLEFYLFVKLQFSLFIDYDTYQKYFEYFCNYNIKENQNIENSNNTNKIKKDI